MRLVFRKIIRSGQYCRPQELLSKACLGGFDPSGTPCAKSCAEGGSDTTQLPPPFSSPPPPFVARRRHMNDVMNYCLSLSKNSRAKFLSTCHWDQPVLRAELVRLRRNLLDKMTDTERDVETRCFICIEPLKVSAVSCPLPHKVGCY